MNGEPGTADDQRTQQALRMSELSYRRLFEAAQECILILTSGFSGVLTVKRVRELGFRELLEKPATARSLGAAVHRVLAHARSTTETPGEGAAGES